MSNWKGTVGPWNVWGPDVDHLCYRPYERQEGGFTWFGDQINNLSGIYIGDSYRIARAGLVEFGVYRGRSWELKYASCLDIRHTLHYLRAHRKKYGPLHARLHSRTWVLLNDRNVFITHGTLAVMWENKERLNTQIARAIMTSSAQSWNEAWE